MPVSLTDRPVLTGSTMFAIGTTVVVRKQAAASQACKATCRDYALGYAVSHAQLKGIRTQDMQRQ